VSLNLKKLSKKFLEGWGRGGNLGFPAGNKKIEKLN
jgi:hypothetical protein